VRWVRKEKEFFLGFGGFRNGKGAGRQESQGSWVKKRGAKITISKTVMQTNI